MRVRFWALWLALLALSESGMANAQPAPGAGSERTVELTLVGRLGLDSVFAARVTSWFEPARFRVRVRTSQTLDPRRVLAPDRDAVVYVWVTLGNDDLARLYFATASGAGEASYLMRDLHLEGGLDEMGAERIAQVLHLSVVALVEGQAESARDEVERTLKNEPAVVSSPASTPTLKDEAAPNEKPRRAASHSAVRMHGGFGYGLSFRGDEGLWHGPRASLKVGFGDLFGVRACAQGALPHKSDFDPITLDMYGVSVALGATLRHDLGPSLSLEWFAGPALDIVHYEPVHASIPDASLGEPETEARPLAALGGRAALGGTPAVVLVAAAAVALHDTHYDVVRGGDREVIGRASAFVPTVGLEVEF